MRRALEEAEEYDREVNRPAVREQQALRERARSEVEMQHQARRDSESQQAEARQAAAELQAETESPPGAPLQAKCAPFLHRPNSRPQSNSSTAKLFTTP